MKYWVHTLSVLAVCWLLVIGKPSKRSSSPSIIMFLADDMGWGDLSSFGHPTQEFGEIDQMAAEGIRFTQWYAAAPLCTPSRTALLTGMKYAISVRR